MPLIPCVGILVNVYLILSLNVDAIYRVLVWTAIGLAIYFGYGIRNSTLRFKVQIQEEAAQHDTHEKRKLISNGVLTDGVLADGDSDQDEGKYRNYTQEDRDEPFTINGGRKG